MSENVAFADLPKQAFPLTLRAYRMDTDELVWEEHVKDAPVFLDVPPLAIEQGVKVWVEVEYADGTKQIQRPEDDDE